MRVQVLAIVAVVGAVHLIGGATVQGAELKALVPIALTYIANQVIPEFEKGTGHKVMITYDTAGRITTSVRMGVAADVAVTAAPQIDGLQNEGKIVPGSSAILAKVGVGVFVPKGHPKLDISSVEALKASLLSAKSIVYSDPAVGGPVGIYMAKLLDELGIGEQMKPKTRLSQGGEADHTMAINAEADLGFNMINEILADARVDLVGPLPPPVQNYTVFAAGLISLSTQQDAGRALIRFLSSPSTVVVMRMRGFE